MRRRKLTEIDLAYNARAARMRRRALAKKNIALLKLWREYRKRNLAPYVNVQPLINAGLLKYDQYGCIREWDAPKPLYRYPPGLLAQQAYDPYYSHPYNRQSLGLRSTLWGIPF